MVGIILGLALWYALLVHGLAKYRSYLGALFHSGVISLVTAIILFVVSTIQALPPLKYIGVVAGEQLTLLQAVLAYAAWTLIDVGVVSLLAAVIIAVASGRRAELKIYAAP